MKRIFLDLGNTRYKWISSDELEKGRVTFRSYPETEPALDVVRSIQGQCEYAHLIIASVKGKVFDQQLSKHLSNQQLAHEWLSIGESPLIPPAYADWSQFGIDRYLNLVAAKDAYDCPLLVISAGTAVTLDLLDTAGLHAGGCIFPGLKLLQQSLSVAAAQIEDVSLNLEKSVGSRLNGIVLGKSTADGVAGGTQTGFVGAINHIATEMQKEISSDVTVLLTGGDAMSLNQTITLPTRVDSLLLFKGMDKVSRTKA